MIRRSANMNMVATCVGWSDGQLNAIGSEAAVVPRKHQHKATLYRYTVRGVPLLELGIN